MALPRLVQRAVWTTLVDAAPSVVQHVESVLTLANPRAQYTNAARYGNWDGKVRFFDRNRQTFLSGLVPHVRDAEPSLRVHQVHVWEPESMPDACRITLADYQEEGVQHVLDVRRCNLQAPTGSGKTEIGIECMRRLGGKVLWVTHLKGLLHQTAARIASQLPSAQIGKVGDGVHETDAPIVVGMVQTLIGLPSRYFERFNVLILDEAHHGAAETWAKVAMACTNATVRVGLSATLRQTKDPVRAMRLEGLTGPTRVLRETMQLADAGRLPTPHVRFVRASDVTPYRTREQIRDHVEPRWRVNPRLLRTVGIKMHRYAYTEGIVRNHARTALLLQIAWRHVRSGDKVLFYINVLEHGDWAARETDRAYPLMPAWYLHGKSLEREAMLADFKKQPFGALLIGSPIFKEGQDVPELDVLVYAAAGESEVMLEQVSGRTMRFRADRPDVYIYDVLDGPGDPLSRDYLTAHTRARVTLFRARGFPIERWREPL